MITGDDPNLEAVFIPSRDEDYWQWVTGTAMKPLPKASTEGEAGFTMFDSYVPGDDDHFEPKQVSL